MSKKSKKREEEAKPKASTWSDLPSFREFVRGLGSPRSSGDYKRAMLAVDRLKAPVVAILLPVLAVVALIVITATTRTDKEALDIQIATVDAADPIVEDPEVEPPDTPDMVAVEPDAAAMDVSVDLPAPAAVAVTSVAPEPDAAQAIEAPVRMTNIKIAPRMKSLGGGDFGVKVGIGGQSGGIPPGYMIGEMFDFKRDAAGNEIADWDSGLYWEQARKLINGGRFGVEAEKHVYKVPARVALNKIWIPTQGAENGPKAFGVGDKMKPRGWLAHYSATLVPKESGRFRFIGDFDDFMACFIDGKVVFEANWSNCGERPASVTGWKSPVGKSPYGIDVVGDWFALKKGQSVRVDICLGERPGGMIGGRLMLDREGATYAMDGKRPVWPLFSSRRLSFREQDAIRKNNESGGFKFATEVSSIFRIQDDPPDGRKPQTGKSATDAIDIEVEI